MRSMMMMTLLLLFANSLSAQVRTLPDVRDLPPGELQHPIYRLGDYIIADPVPMPPEPGTPVLINGEVVDKVKYPAIVSIRIGNNGCTASIIGPRVVLTAAHCGNTGNLAQFNLATTGKLYKGTVTRSGLYPNVDHDMAVIILTEAVEGISFESIGGAYEKSKDLHIYGYGCTQPNGTGGNDGKLRYGKARMNSVSGYDIVSGNGAALCFGDSGGPAFVLDEKGRRLQLGVNSKGDIRTTNYDTRTDVAQSRTFLKAIADKHKVEICGINKDCLEGPIVIPPTDRVEVTKDYLASELGLPIPDGAVTGLEYTIEVDQLGTFMDLGVEVELEHKQPRDLVIDLVSPQKKGVRLLARPLTLKEGVVVLKYGLGGLPVDLKIFDGEGVQGEWHLVVRDVAPGDEGELKKVKLSVKSLVK